MSLDFLQKGIGRLSFGFKVTVSPQSHNVKDFKLKVRQVKLQAHGNLLPRASNMHVHAFSKLFSARRIIIPKTKRCLFITLYAQSAG